MGASRAAEDVEVRELGDQAADDVFDGICRRELQISGREFLDRWDAGLYAGVDVDSVEGLSDVVTALPLVR